MGGYGSGASRWRTKTRTDHSRVLDINRMVKTKAISQQGWSSGLWCWSDAETGERKASISYEANTQNPDNCYLRVHYTLTEKDQKIDYRIPLEISRPNYGGKRFWFRCPFGHVRTTKLYLPSGGDVFASRRAWKMAYSSQSETPSDRVWRKVHKLQNKIGTSYSRRPKGMHKKTYERLWKKAMEAEEQADFYFVKMMNKYAKLFS